MIKSYYSYNFYLLVKVQKNLQCKNIPYKLLYVSQFQNLRECILKVKNPDGSLKIIVILRQWLAKFRNQFRSVKISSGTNWLRSEKLKNNNIEKHNNVPLLEKKGESNDNIKLKSELAVNYKFLKIIAHDLSGHMHSIIGLSKIMLEEYKADKDYKVQEYHLEAIHETSKSVYELLESLLKWSLAKNGGYTFKSEKIEMKKIVSEVVNIYSQLAANKNIKVENKIDPAMTVYSDVQIIKTIVRNLLSNAVKFTHPGGEIVISSEYNIDFINIIVADSGRGMEKEIIDKLFAPDLKYSTKGTDNEPGSGMGMLICKELIEKIDGKIYVESKPGKGSNFIVSLPVMKNI